MKNTIFRILAGVGGIYHVVLAAIGLLLPAELISKAVPLALGVTLEINPQILFISKFVSVYMLVFGIMLLILSYNPSKYRILTIPVLVLFGMRFLNRIIFFGLLSSELGMTATRNIIGTTLILIFTVALWITMPKKQS